MFPLVRYFSIASAVTIVLATIAVSAVITVSTTQQLIEEREASNVDLTRAFANVIWPSLRGHDAEIQALGGDELRSHPRTARLAEQVRDLMAGLSIVKVNLYAANGNTLFSTEAGAMGESKAASPGFRAAAAGQVTTEIAHHEHFQAPGVELVDVDVIGSFVPIRGPDGAVEAVFEVHDDVTGTLATVEFRRNRLILLISLLFLGVYMVLWFVVRRAADRLHDQHDEIMTAKTALEATNGELAEEIRMREAAQSELQAAHETLLQKERLATLGQLTATVSHELRNPMGAIRSSLFLVKQKTAEAELGIERALDRAERNIVRCDGIISDLLDYARETAPKLAPLAVDDWLTRTLADMEQPEDVEIVVETGAADASITVDEEWLRRVVINLYDNALQAMAEQPEERPRRLAVSSGLGARGLEVVFEDSGPGMDEETLGRIFEPLFSTKSFGVGLGLPTVKKVLEAHGGGIEYQSEVGVGTRVTVWLPIEGAEREAA